MFLRVVLEDEDGPVADHLVRHLVHRHDLVQRLFQRHTVELHRDRTILHVAVVGDVDAGQSRHGAQHVLEARVVEAHDERLAGRGVQDGFGRCGACTLAQCLNRRRGTRRFNPVANHPVERRNLCAREAVARIVLGGEPVLADRGVELIFLLEVARLLEVRPRRREHRALERDPELGVVRRRLDGPPIGRNGFVQIAGAGGRVTLPVRLPGGASRRQHRQPHQECKSLQPSRHRCSQSELRACGKA